MSVEDRKKERFKKTLDAILDINPITALSRRVNKAARNLLKGKLTKEKEFTIKGLISDLKLEVGDRGAAEAMPKKAFEKSVLISKARKGMKNAKPAFRGMTQQEMRSSKDKKFMGHTGRDG